MVNYLFPGIYLYDIDIDLVDTVNDIEEMAKLNNIGVRWQKTFKFSKKHKNFGFMNLSDEKKVNQSNGGDILLYTLSKMALDIFDKPSKEYFKNNGIINQEFNNFYFTKFEKGAEQLHVYDDDSLKNNKRVSFKYFINDNYAGGEIYFPNFQIAVKPEKGKLLIHPSNYAYNYIDNKITDGTKYQLITWI